MFHLIKYQVFFKKISAKLDASQKKFEILGVYNKGKLKTDDELTLTDGSFADLLFRVSW